MAGDVSVSDAQDAAWRAPSPAPLVFFSYSHADEALRDELARHLAMLERSGYVSAWHDRRIEPGEDWAGEIDARLESAQVILLLVSPDFLASKYCYDVEMRRALERHERGEAVVVPILLRPVDWEGAPFARLQVLPIDARPVTSWPNRDEAFADVARQLRRLVTSRFLVAPPLLEDGSARPGGAVRAQDRVLDAAIARKVVVGHPTALLAFVRRSGSAGLATFLDAEEDVSPEDVRSRGFRLEFPVDSAGALAPVTVSITLASPEFQPPSQTKSLRVPPDGDSVICRFLLVPTCVGELTVSVELAVGELHQAARALKTRAEAGDRRVIVGGISIVTIPLATSARPEATAAAPPPPAAGRAAAEPRPSPPPTPVPLRAAERVFESEAEPEALPAAKAGRRPLAVIAGGVAAVAAAAFALVVMRAPGGKEFQLEPDRGEDVEVALPRARSAMDARDYALVARSLHRPIAALDRLDKQQKLTPHGRKQLADALELSAMAHQGLGDEKAAIQHVDRLLQLDRTYHADPSSADPRFQKLVEERRAEAGLAPQTRTPQHP